MSAAGRVKIVAAQRARWAKVKEVGLNPKLNLETPRLRDEPGCFHCSLALARRQVCSLPTIPFAVSFAST